MAYKTQYQTLFSYHATMFNRLLDCAEQLNTAEREALHSLLFHVLSWHTVWRTGVEGDSNNPGLQAEDFLTMASLRAGMATEHALWQQLIGGLHEADFETERTVIGSTFPLWRILQHLILHGMQHHAEAAALLTAKGYSPGGIDFIWYTG